MEDPTIVVNTTHKKPNLIDKIRNIQLPFNKKAFASFVGFLLLTVGFVSSLILVKENQDIREKAAGTTPVVRPTITNLFINHWDYGRPWFVGSLPNYFSIFIDQTYTAFDRIPALTNPIVANYIGSDFVVEPGMHGDNYPITYEGDILKDETTFVHSTNPAELLTIKGSGTINLYWKYDERYSDFSQLQYAIYRVENTNIDTAQLWDQTWKDKPWTRLSTPSGSVTYNDSGRFLSFSDSTFSTSSSKTCYLIKTIQAGEELYYSLPTCINNPGSQQTPSFYFTGSDVIRTAKVDVPTDNLYSTNTYSIKAVMNNSNFTSPKVLLYGNDGGYQLTANQYSYNFHLVASYNMQKGINGATLELPLIRPYLLNKGGQSRGFTEEPTFRITAVNSSGQTVTYPSDGGYLVLGSNNKLYQRFWTGYTAIPSSTYWKSRIVSEMNRLKSIGYNTTYFDLWMAGKYDLKTRGNEFDAPPLEFPQNWSQIGDGRDPSSKAFANLGKYIRENKPSGMLVIGNSLTLDPLTLNVIKSDPTYGESVLDGAMFEACIHAGKEKFNDDKIIETFNYFDQANATGKKILCQPSFDFGDASFLSPVDRIFTLSAYMMVTQNKETQKSYFGWSEIWPSWGPQANYYAEYFIDIGNPTAARTKPATDFYQRRFTNGSISLNAASGTTRTLASNKDTYKAIIDGVDITRNTNGSVTYIPSSGYVRYQKINTGQAISVPPGTGLIFVDHPTVPKMSSLHFEAEDGLLTSGSSDFYFVSKDGSIYMNNSTADKTKVAKAEYSFNIPEEGDYIVKMNVVAYHDYVNSIYVNIDSDATDHLWTISPLSNDFVERTLSWDGTSGPKVFHLAQGDHRFVITGHEPVKVDYISIEKYSTDTPTPSPTITPTPTASPSPTATPTPSPTPNAGDINNDTVVNSFDYVILSYSYGKSDGEEGYDDRADLKDDGVVNSLDYAILSFYYGNNQ